MQTCITQDPQGTNEQMQRSSCKLIRAKAVWFYPAIFGEEDLPETWKPLPRIGEERYYQKDDGTEELVQGTTIQFPDSWTVEIR